VVASGNFCGGLEQLGGLGRLGVCGNCCSLGSVVECVGTVSVFEFYLNRPRVGGCHGVCEYFSQLTAPSTQVSNLAAGLLLLFLERFVNQIANM
jgi:hypothetical protein